MLHTVGVQVEVRVWGSGVGTIAMNAYRQPHPSLLPEQKMEDAGVPLSFYICIYIYLHVYIYAYIYIYLSLSLSYTQSEPVFRGPWA